MATTRKLKTIIIRMDDTEAVTNVEVVGDITTVDADNPTLDFTRQDSILVTYDDMLAGEQTAVDNFVGNVKTAVVARIRPIV